MASEFHIPSKAQDLINEDVELPFKVRRLHNFEDAAPAEIEEYAEGGQLSSRYQRFSIGDQRVDTRH